MPVLRLLAVLACLLSSLALAQTPYVPEGLSQTEMQALELQGLNDAALNTWNRLAPYALAAENLRRAALLERCTKITSAKPDDYYFDPTLRAALDGVVDKMRAGKVFQITLEGFRHRARTPLWAARHTSAADWQAVRQLAQSPAGQLALQRIRAGQVMASYDPIDVNTGAWLAYLPIALKAYFTQSSQTDTFDRALRTVGAELAADFARVRPLEQHTAADLAWLSRLSQTLAEKMPEISKAFFELLPAGERKVLDTLYETAYFRLYDDASDAVTTAGLGEASLDDPKFRGLAPGMRDKPNYLAFVRASLDREFPLSPEELLSFGIRPAQVVGSAHWAFCP